MSTGTPTEPPREGGAGDSGSEKPRPFGNYWLLKELGRGAQGVVYLAEDQTLRRKVALKVLTSAGAQSQVTRDRFRREAELTSRFEHPGICGVHDVGEVDGLPYIAMQYVRGTTLASLVDKARNGGASGDASVTRSAETISIVSGDSKGGLEDVLRLLERAARALHVAHEAGLVHRDVKPANIMVNADGYPVLLDFGLARDLDGEGQTLTQSGQIMGTPAYLAPEQIVAARGPVDRRTDVYALGVTLFECLTLHRPFESATWDALFHEILDGTPRNPREFNPRLPADLRTVIEVAMDRDPARRYPTAEALAEDLRRVRSFEPIRAKSAGPIARLRKWARRHPARATGAVAVAVFVTSALTIVSVRAWQRAHDLRDHLRAANEALVRADYTGAALAVSKAQELDPESLEVIGLLARVDRAQKDAQRAADRAAALSGAERARVEAEAFGASYADTRRRIDELSASILQDESEVLAEFAPEPRHADLSAREEQVEALRIDAERLLLLRSEALERALRLEDPWGGASEATQSAMATFYLEQWREATANGNTVRAEAMRTFTERYDTRGEHRGELLGRGTIAFAPVPSDATAWLFRFENYTTVRRDPVVPRLVPVPTAGVGRVREHEWTDDFHPGDLCLVVTSVESDGFAARAGLRPGDLILRYGDHPATGRVFVRDVSPRSCLAREGVAPLTPVATVDGHPIATPFDWTLRLARRDGTPVSVTLEGRAENLECPPDEIPIADATELIREGASVPVRWTCLRGGVILAIDAPAETRGGLECETTAYPLIASDANRISPGEPRDVDPGSYVILVGAPGFETQRFLVKVDRGRDVEAHVTLLAEGSTPPGYVYVPPGPFVEGGDPDAFRPRGGREVDVEGFFLARRELTNREWYEFVNDPATLARIADAKPGEHLYLPQDDRVLAQRDPNGPGYVFDVYGATTPESPVLGLTWTDVRDYLEWRNARAEAGGEAWRYTLPTESQWEKAARGVDERRFTWGYRFDTSLAVCLVRQDTYLLDAPGGHEPRDESPYGVLDMAGSREEWLLDAVEDVEPPRYRKRGGHWGSKVETVFRAASRGEASQDRFASSQGVRLVAVRADPSRALIAPR